MEYSNLHHKSHYSCGLAFGTGKRIINVAKEKDLKGIALTDYCTMSGLLEFYDLGKSEDFPVILGVEMFYADYYNQTFKIVLIIHSQAGYNNLCQLLTYAYENEQIYNIPACTIEDLKDFSEGLICISSNDNGPWSKHYLENNQSDAFKKAKIQIDDLYQIFKDDFYIELSSINHQFKWSDKEKEYIQQFDINPNIQSCKDAIKHCNRNNINYIISSDSYIPNESDKSFQDVIIKNTIAGKNGFYFRENRAIQTAEELQAKFHLMHIYDSKIEKAFENTVKITDKCKDLELNFEDQVISYPWIFHPLYQDGMKDKLELVYAILKDYNRVDLNNPIHKERIEYEIDAICNNARVNLIDYFLVVEDLCRWCHENDIIMSPGRGSGAGSLLNYGLEITHKDPLKYDLLFERFISKGRIEKGNLPDIDLDFSDQPRVKEYLISKYGSDRVASIGTFQTMKTKSTIKDSFRLFYPEVEFQDVNAITQKFGKKEENETEIEYFERNLEENEILKDTLQKKYPKVYEIIPDFLKSNRQTGRHPCGIAITQRPLKEIVPIRYSKGNRFLDYNLNICEKVGVIKYDILSLRTLKYIGTCIKEIKKRHNVVIDIYNLPEDDPKVLNQFKIGNTSGIFQFLSDIAISILTGLDEIPNLECLAMTTSVGRPGPMGNQQHIEFIERQNGNKDNTPPHESLRELLEPTSGIMIYQESVMRASQILGGFSLAEADDIRRAMGKKKFKVLIPYKERFIKNAQEKYEDIDEDKAIHIWKLMETFASYGFNKSHAVCYADLGYICMYLKTYYPLEWWYGCLIHTVDDKPDHFRNFFKACKDIVKLPDINKSKDHFYITDDNFIQMPFTAVKKVGIRANEEINKNRPFTSFKDFLDRSYKRVINKGIVVRLIFANAFQEFDTNYKNLLEYYFIEYRKEKLPPQFEIMTKEKLIEFAQESLSFIQLDYYEVYKDTFDDYIMPYSELNNKREDEWISLAGKITKVEFKQTRKKQPMAKLVMQNKDDVVKLTVFSDELIKYKHCILEGNVIQIEGRVNEYMGYKSVLVTHIFDLKFLNERRKNNGF